MGNAVVETLIKTKVIQPIEALSKTGKILMHMGYGLNMLLNVHNNFSDNSLSTNEKWVGFVIDSIHTTGQTGGAYGLSFIPYAGPFLSIGVPIFVDYLWTGDLYILGIDWNVEPLWLIEGKTPEEWVKERVVSWFD